jgi:hypothetical protein
MKLRVTALSVAVGSAALGLIPFGTMSASAATAARAAGPTTNVSVEVVTPLPRNIIWRDDAFYRGQDRLPLPRGYDYRGGGVFGPNGNLVYARDTAHEGVVVVPMECRGGKIEFSPVTTTNYLANIINGAFNAARSAVEAAAGIAQAATGAASTPGAKC